MDEEIREGAGEAPAEPCAPAWVPGSRFGLSGELVDAVREDARLRRTVAGLNGAGQRAALLNGLLDGLGDEHASFRRRSANRLLDGLIAGKRGEGEILAQGGVLGQLTRRLIESAPGDGLSEHLSLDPPRSGVGSVRA